MSWKIMSRWAKQFNRVGRDTVHLARAVANQRGRNVRPLLLEHARQSNSVATSLLTVDKEVGLLKYYGLQGYLKQRTQPKSTSTGIVSTGNAESGDSTQGTAPTAAKVAFMVTSSMKQELNARLGYDTDQIKSMTPLQASLILNHSIPPAEMEEKLPAAEQEYVELRQKEEEARKAQIEMAQKEAAAQVQEHPQPFSEAMNEAEFGSGTYMSRNLLLQPGGMRSGFGGETWFEVVETKDGETSRVGLYMDEEEAELGRDARQHIATVKAVDAVFEVLPVPRASL